MRRALAISFATALCGACVASAAAPVRVALVGRPPASLVAGQAWIARLAVRPVSTRGAVRVLAARAGERFAVRATTRGSYRARLVFPSPGRWTLRARVGRWTSPLGSVLVRPARPQPLDLRQPTTMELEPTGTLLVVENGLGRLLRVDPATGRVSVVSAQLGSPFGLSRAPSGDLFVSDDNRLRRIDGTGAITTVAEMETDVGPVAAAPNGDVYFTTATLVFRLVGGAGPRVHVAGTGIEGFGGDGGPAASAPVRAPHGLAVDLDGALLISDTGNDRIRRIDPATGVITSIAEIGIPGGMDLGVDGTIYVVEARTNRVLRLERSGGRTGVADGRLVGPIDVEVAADGTVFVLEGGESPGRIRRVAPDGTVATVLRGSG